MIWLYCHFVPLVGFISEGCTILNAFHVNQCCVLHLAVPFFVSFGSKCCLLYSMSKIVYCVLFKLMLSH